MGKKKTTEEFIEEAKRVHGDKYDYSNVVYVNNNTKVEIVCPKHGSFYQVPRTHISAKFGCPKCGGVSSYNDFFIAKSIAIYGDKYDFSNTIYTKSNVRVCVICPKHGEFFVTPNNFLNGHSCPKCSKENRTRNRNKIIYGAGMNDYDGSCVDDNGKLIQSYKIWFGMIRRCYDENSLKNKATYKDCYVCAEWLFFSNFKKWFDEKYIDGYAIDKDILFKENRMYSPTKCCFVPDEINTLFIKNERHRGECVIGVAKHGDSYSARINKGGEQCHLGTFYSEEEAFAAYKEAKESYIREVAEKYKGKIEDDVYQALLSYKVEKTD